MRGITSFVVDQYDDSRGEVLVSRFPTQEAIPEFVKTAHRLSGSEHENLPDDAFALVLFDEGQKMRKFAMIDKGNTALSAVYLLEQGHLLPPEAVKTAASNIIAACEHYGLDIPELLKEAAKNGVSGIPGKSQTPYARGAKVNKMQFNPTQKAPDVGNVDNPQLGKHEEDEDLKSRVNLDSPQGTNFVTLPHFSQKETVKGDHPGGTAEKQAGFFGNLLKNPNSQELDAAFKLYTKQTGKPPEHMTHDEIGHYVDQVRGHVKTAGWFGDSPGENRSKQKGWREAPHMDITGWDPRQAFTNVEPAAQETLLRGHYPVDTFDQVKTASVYFEENWKQFAPRDRHTYCVKLAQKLASLNLPISEGVERYGSETYASDVDDLALSRKAVMAPEYHSSLDLLIEKRASISPETFAEALFDIDHMAGLHFHYGAHVVDPWYTTFGPSKEKVASSTWTYDHMGTRIDEAMLKALATNGPHIVRQSFGEKFTAEFQKSPKDFFEALPKPQKLVLARLAADPHCGTASE